MVVERLHQVEMLIAQRVTHREICDRLEEEWGVGERQIRKYLALVYARRRKEHEQRRPHEIMEVRMTFDTIIRGAIEDRKWGDARAALVDLCKFDGHAMGGGGLDDAVLPAAPAAAGQILIENLNLQIRGEPPVLKTSRLRELAARREAWIAETGQDPAKLPVPQGDDDGKAG